MSWEIDYGDLPPVLSMPSTYNCVAVETIPEADDIDDRTMDYVLASRLHYNNLNKAIAQIAGLLVLGAAGGRCPPDHPMMAVAEELYGTATQSLGWLRLTSRSAHHHHHLRMASHNVGQALVSTKLYLRLRDDQTLDAASRQMKSAYRELLAASRCLPGFEVVALSDGCCGAHARVNRLSTEGIQREWRTL